MVILVGILCIIFMCSSILILSSLTISLYQKKNPSKKNFRKKTKDFYSYLFDVYDDNFYM
jgi:hypothetical protein